MVMVMFMVGPAGIFRSKTCRVDRPMVVIWPALRLAASPYLIPHYLTRLGFPGPYWCASYVIIIRLCLLSGGDEGAGRGRLAINEFVITQGSPPLNCY